MKIRLIGMMSAAAIIVCAQAAHAGLMGSTVNVSVYFPDSASNWLDPGDVTVSGALEYPTGSYFAYHASWAIDISDTQLIITDSLSSGFPFNPATFNGWILSVVSGPSILSAVEDGASGLSPFAISVVGGNLLLNYQGVQGPTAGCPRRLSILRSTRRPIPGHERSDDDRPRPRAPRHPIGHDVIRECHPVAS